MSFFSFLSRFFYGTTAATDTFANPNRAQRIMLDLIGNGKKRDYKAPHAPRGTPKKVHYPRTHRQSRLFKGHRI
jgi:DNA primase